MSKLTVTKKKGLKKPDEWIFCAKDIQKVSDIRSIKQDELKDLIYTTF